MVKICYSAVWIADLGDNFNYFKSTTDGILSYRELGSDWETTRLEALRWIAVLLERHRTEVLHLLLYLSSEVNFLYCL